MLISRFGFTDSALDIAHRTEPVRLDLLDLRDIQVWIERREREHPDDGAAVHLLIRSISHDFATMVAKNPSVLDHLEWRDLERMMARVMEGLGFDVTLTPPSKDGGKDLILKCTAKRGNESYIVELKHWRSGKQVGKRFVSDFMHIIVQESRPGGLFLSTSGYAKDTFEGLNEFTRQRLRLGEQSKIVLLAQTYVRACSGLWSPPAELPELLFEGTL
jgi:restriction system protein